MAHVIQLAFGAFLSSLGVKGHTKSSGAHECDQQFGENESIDIWKSQRLRKEGNTRINKVSAMEPGLAEIIEKVRISRYFESAETDRHIAENPCCIDYANTWSPKRVHWWSKSQRPYRGDSNYECQDPLEHQHVVAQARIPITRIHTRVAHEPRIQRLPAILYNSWWMDHCAVCYGSVEPIPILDPVDVEEAYSHIASHYHSVQWYVQYHGWCDASFGKENNSMEGRRVLPHEVSLTEAVRMLRGSNSIDRNVSCFCTYGRSFQAVAIV